MKLTYLGQMCYLIECGDLKIVTDPYLSDSVDSKDSHRELPRRQPHSASFCPTLL